MHAFGFSRGEVLDREGERERKKKEEREFGVHLKY